MAERKQRADKARRPERYIDAIDLMLEAQRRCLLARLLVEQVVAIVGQNRLDEKLTVLVYASERSARIAGVRAARPGGAQVDRAAPEPGLRRCGCLCQTSDIASRP